MAGALPTFVQITGPDGKTYYQVQPDWADKNTYSPAFVKNKSTSGFVQQNSDWNATSGVTAILNKPVFPPGLLPSSMPKASDVGILANDSDQTSIINTILANSAYSGIILDNSPAGAYVISGTVNGGGKTIIFYPGNYFTGSGTLNNVVLSAGYNQKLFDISVSITNSKTQTDSFSSAWYGADLTGSADSQPNLQKTSDTMIANTAMTRTLYMVPGVYKTNTTWMLHDWNGSTYVGQWTLNIVGNWRAAYSNDIGFPLIVPTFKTGPVIGAQRGIGYRIMGICIRGLFTSSIAYDTFVQTTFASANTAAVRDSQYSPYCGIAIDPVTNNPATIPPDGGFPTLNGSEPGGLNWYRGTGSRGGSSAAVISNCHIIGFTVDIANSVNGNTQQGEDCIIEDCFLDTCNVAVAYTQTQNDNCHIYRCRSWDNVWIVVDTRSYGAQKGLAPSIHGYNVAGTVNTLFNIGSIKPFTIENFYAESFFTMGSIVCNANGSTVNGNFNFGLSNFTPRYHLIAQNISFVGGAMRYYDDLFNKRLRLLTPSNVCFDNVMFDLPPYEIGQQDSQSPTVKYSNCNLAGSYILGAFNNTFFANSATIGCIPYGKFKIQDAFNSPSLTLDYDNTLFNRIISFTDAITITPDGSRNASFTVSAGNALLCRINDIVYDDATRVVIGRISNISGTTITISEIPTNIVAGTYTLDLVYFVSANNNCVGDTTSGSNQITNVCPLFPAGYINSFANDFRFDTTMFPAGAYITGYNNTTRIITMSANANLTAIRQNFINGNPKIEVVSPFPPSSSSVNSYNRGLPTGTKWTEQVNTASSSVFRETIWIFSKGGYVSATTLGLGAGLQAEFNILPPIRFDGTNYQAYNTYTDTWTTL